MTTRALARRGSAACRAGRGLHGVAGPLITLATGSAAALAIASTVAFVLVLVLVAAHAALETAPIRARRARRTARRDRRTRRERRGARLEATGATTFELEDLADLVEQVIEHDARDSLELESLLDRYVELAIARQHCLTAAGHAQPDALAAKLAIARPRRALSVALVERRIARARAVEARAREYESMLEELAELIRYYGERASTPEEPEPDSDLVATALARCDALEELSSR
jgi:hypothetical protein